MRGPRLEVTAHAQVKGFILTTPVWEWPPQGWAHAVGHGAAPAILFSKLRVTFSWNKGVGRKGQRTAELGEKGGGKERCVCPHFSAMLRKAIGRERKIAWSTE